MDDFEIISLDLETSSSESETGTILSIGCVWVPRCGEPTSQFYMEARHKMLTISPEACRVHGMDMKLVDDSSKTPLVQIDVQLRDWLCNGDGTPRKNKRIPMGLNVGTFDMEFVHRYLPKSASIFGRRSMDLNAMIFGLAFKYNESFYNLKKKAKRYAKEYADTRCNDFGPHNALWDAWSNIGMYDYLMWRIKQEECKNG